MTMGLRSHNTDAPGPWSELPDILSEAVRQVREAPVPADVEKRTLDRACRLAHRGPQAPHWPTRRLWLCSGVVAASLLVGLGLYLDRYPPSGYQAAIPDVPKNPVVAVGTSPDSGTKPGRPHVIFLRLPSGPDSDLLPVGLPDHDDWERVKGLRALSSSMPSVDRKGIEAYVRHLPGLARDRGVLPFAQASIRAADGTTLTPLGVYVQVVIEGPRARTLVDHVFRNLSARPLSGTFTHTLPDGASPCCFTLFPGRRSQSTTRGDPHAGNPSSAPLTLPDPDQFVRGISQDCWGTPCIAFMAHLERPARRTSDGGPPCSCFCCPVGEVAPGSFLRVVLAYEEVLPWRDGKVEYRFRLPAGKLAELSFSLQADASLAKDAVLSPPDGDRKEVAGKVIFTHRWKKAAPGGQVCFQTVPPDATVQATSDRPFGGPHYLYARLRPTVPALSHRRPRLVVRRLRFEGGPAARDLHVAARRAAGHPGVELLLAARFSHPGATRIVLEGEVDGKKVTQVFPVEVHGEGQLAARGWAELAVNALVAGNTPDQEARAVALAQQFRVASRYTAFALSNVPATGHDDGGDVVRVRNKE
jgi:hypothetical protein